MAKQSLSEQLDRAVTALLAQPEAALPEASPRIAALAKLAAELRHLPGERFRDRLREELEWEAKMSKAAETRPVREGFHTITPYIAVREAPELFASVKRAFGAAGQVLATCCEGGIHAEMKIGDSRVMTGGGTAWEGTPLPTSLPCSGPYASSVCRRALEAGARHFQRLALHGADSQEKLKGQLIEPRHREDIRRLAARWGARSVRVFGSVARGEARPDSDIDLLVDFEAGRSLLDQAGLLVDLEDALGWKVDLVSIAGLKPRLRDRILREALTV